MISIANMVINYYLYSMNNNKVRKSIDIPRDKEFKADLTRIALDRQFGSSKEMIEHDVVKMVEDYRNKNRNNNVRP